MFGGQKKGENVSDPEGLFFPFLLKTPTSSSSIKREVVLVFVVVFEGRRVGRWCVEGEWGQKVASRRFLHLVLPFLLDDNDDDR